MNLTSDQLAFIDDYGASWDRLGGAPLHGRILGLLYIAEESEVGAIDLCNVLGVSRGAVSQATRQLIQIGLVQRVTRRGERRDYYRVVADAWMQTARAQRGQIGPFLALLQRGLALHNTSPPDRRDTLAQSIAFLEAYDAMVASFLERWPTDDPESPCTPTPSKPPG